MFYYFKIPLNNIQLVNISDFICTKCPVRKDKSKNFSLAT